LKRHLLALACAALVPAVAHDVAAQPAKVDPEKAKTAKQYVDAAIAAQNAKDCDPANSPYQNMITVAASDNSDAKPSWSNYGRAKVAVSSPGLNIFSTLPANKYGNLSGTSMATPLVAGLVALLESQKDVTGPEARAFLQSTGPQVQIETACMCRVDAAAALQAVKNNKLTVVPAAGTVLAGVDPDVGGEIRMRVVHARVDHADDDVRAPLGDLPGLERVDVRIG